MMNIGPPTEAQESGKIKYEEIKELQSKIKGRFHGASVYKWNLMS